MTNSAQKDFINHYEWDSEQLDLNAYLERVGYHGPLDPTVDTLRALNAAHSRSIPFENIDVLAGREIRLDLPSLVDKIVTRRRGGYCYEHNILFAAVLEKVGFQVHGLGARLINGPDQNVLRSASHAALLVTIDDRRFVADVGFGSGLQPVELIDDNEIEFGGGWRYKVNFIDRDMWILRSWSDGTWSNVHKFTLTPFYRADFVDANYIAQHHPRSPFHKTITIGKSKSDQHVDLMGTKLTRSFPDGATIEETLDTNDIAEVVLREFDLRLTDEERNTLMDASKPLSSEDLMGD